VLFVAGHYLHAINQDGGQLWRVSTAEGIAEASLSSDENLLYIQGSHHLYAYETRRGRQLWKLENECEYYFRCRPQPLANGSVAMKWALVDSQVARGGPSTGLRIIARNGKVLAERNPTSGRFEYLVPAGHEYGGYLRQRRHGRNRRQSESAVDERIVVAVALEVPYGVPLECRPVLSSSR
jgi:hypothetical protein